MQCGRQAIASIPERGSDAAAGVNGEAITVALGGMW